MTNRNASQRIALPYLCTAARRAGATKIVRCSDNVFSVGFELIGTDHSVPGNGPAVVAALRTWASNGIGCAVTWGGSQADAIVLTFP